MNWLAVVSAVAGVSSAAAAACAVWFASRSFHQSAEMFLQSAELKAFLALNERYERIMSGLRDRTTKDWPEEWDPGLRIRLRYLNLCSEERCLKDKGLLSETLWGIWQGEIKATLASPPYIRAWPRLRSEFESYPEFQKFVDEVVENAHGTHTTSSAAPMHPAEPDPRAPSSTRARDLRPGDHAVGA